MRSCTAGLHVVPVQQVLQPYTGVPRGRAHESFVCLFVGKPTKCVGLPTAHHIKIPARKLGILLVQIIEQNHTLQLFLQAPKLFVTAIANVCHVS